MHGSTPLYDGPVYERPVMPSKQRQPSSKELQFASGIIGKAVLPAQEDRTHETHFGTSTDTRYIVCLASKRQARLPDRFTKKDGLRLLRIRRKRRKHRHGRDPRTDGEHKKTQEL